MRIAHVIRPETEDIETIARYLPDNYRAIAENDGGIRIEGEDVAGWTLDGYVIPRLASGLHWAKEDTKETN